MIGKLVMVTITIYHHPEEKYQKKKYTTLQCKGEFAFLI